MKSQVPDKPTLFRLLARVGKKVMSSDLNVSDRPTTLNEVSVETSEIL